MRKGSKRKASQKEDSKSPEELPKDSTKASSRGKRVKAPAAPKQKEEPEFFPEKRNLEDLWQAAFPVGTEWDQLDLLNQYKWEFSNLENAFEEGGDLYEKKVYLFGATEPQMVFFKGEGKVVCIPTVVAVVSPFPPSDKIGINSVQREAEEIVPMKKMKMDWVPYIPLENRFCSLIYFSDFLDYMFLMEVIWGCSLIDVNPTSMMSLFGCHVILQG
uniref:Uncharacterized protein n=1 Tax=Nelumbo nucifera TaxID=4432 RepID=A0A822XN54_NELNU|nr:TPA_asm: hypothetical protein HUJ06_023293 [Nelumbo nucifera]